MGTMLNQIIHGDCLEVMKRFGDNSIDSIVTDPPYELGFMGKAWDKSGIAYNVEVWRECLRVLKPGGHMLAFGGTRTYHRMAAAIEDAGFEIRDQIQWLYGSGFPKSHDISKAIDKTKRGELVRAKIKYFRQLRGLNRNELAEQLGIDQKYLWDWEEDGHSPSDKWWNKIIELLDITKKEELEFEREVLGSDIKARSTSGKSALPTIGGQTVYETWDITAPATPEAVKWEGWGTALKPANEPLCLARKPLGEKTIAANVLEWGTGGMNIGGCRVETEDDLSGVAYAKDGKKREQMWGEDAGNSWRRDKGLEYQQPKGRFPADVILDEEYIPILRLTNSSKNGKTSLEEDEIIRGFYHDYIDLSTMPRRVSSVSEPSEEWEKEILQQELLPQGSECPEQRREPSPIREKTQTGVHSKDEGKKERECEIRRGEPCLQGVLDEQGVQIPQHASGSGGAPTNCERDDIAGRPRCCGTPLNDGGSPQSSVNPGREGTSQERSERRQQDRELGFDGQCRAHEGLRNPEEKIQESSERNRTLEVLACDVPKQWLKYFEPTGFEVRSPYCAGAMLDEQSGERKTGKVSKHHKSTTPTGNGNTHGVMSGIATDRGFGDTGGASRFFYCAKTSKKERGEGNNHPTVKPQSLMRYLCRLITPPEGVVLDPFAGSGSTILAAICEGFGYIGIEKDANYCEIARKRVGQFGG